MITDYNLNKDFVSVWRWSSIISYSPIPDSAEENSASS